MSDLRPAPYPADTRAKGWRFEVDLERVRQSDTWALAAADVRPWLLMLWCSAWEQCPCGSLPADDELISARIGMAPKAFSKHRAILMRGWWLADDGRLYHPTITALVLAMSGRKDAERQRKAAYRDRMSRGTDAGQTRDSTGRDDTGTGTGTGSKPIPKDTKPDGLGAEAPSPTDQDVVFANGLTLLTAAGVSEKNARSFLAMQCKDHGPGMVRSALERCASEAPVQPIPWLQAALKSPAVARSPPPSRSDALMAKNLAVLQRFAEPTQ